MRDLLEEVEFETGETVFLYRQSGDRFLVKASIGNEFSREKVFEKKDIAFDFFDTFIDGNDVIKYINEMLQEMSSSYKIATIPYHSEG